MNINAAPRNYASNFIADSDLDMGQYNVRANSIFPKDNYLLTMLDYGEAFPTDVQEGDKLFAWGEDSTKSYIHTYLNGSWDAGVSPRHMQDYYIADEERTVKFFKIVPTGSEFLVFDFSENGVWIMEQRLGLVFSECYIIGSLGLSMRFISDYPTDSSCTVDSLSILCTSGTSSYNSVQVVSGKVINNKGSWSGSVVVPSGVSSLTYRVTLASKTSSQQNRFRVYSSYDIDD